MGVDDVNALYGARPAVFDRLHRAVLIRVAREYRTNISDEELYEATRCWWRVDKRRRALGSQRAPEMAMAVYRGVVRAVYRIEGWEEPTEALIVEDPRRLGRWGFWGRRDPDLEMQYLFSDVTGLLPQSAQNPLRYINC